MTSFSDRRYRAGGHIGVHAVRQVVHQRTSGHQPVYRRRVHIDRNGRAAVVPVVPGMCGRRQGSQVHAVDGMALNSALVA